MAEAAVGPLRSHGIDVGIDLEASDWFLVVPKAVEMVGGKLSFARS